MVAGIIPATFSFMKIYDKNRAKYIKKIENKKFKVCELCNPKNLKKQECKNLRGKYWTVIVNKYPYLDGNLMIISRRHDIFEIKDIKKEEWSELHEVIKNAQNRLAKIFNTKSFNIGINIGKEAGNSLEHMHWQIIPRGKEVPNSANILADLHSIKISPWELKNRVEKIK